MHAGTACARHTHGGLAAMIPTRWMGIGLALLLGGTAWAQTPDRKLNPVPLTSAPPTASSQPPATGAYMLPDPAKSGERLVVQAPDQSTAPKSAGTIESA